MKNKILLIGIMIAASYSTQAFSIAVVSETGIVNGYGTYAYAYAGESMVSGGELSSSATASKVGSGASATASAMYVGSTSYLPELKVTGSSAVGQQASAHAFGAQGYHYAGGAESITLNFNLHGSVGDNDSGSATNALGVSIAVIDSGALWSPGHLTWETDFGTLIYETVGGAVLGEVVNLSIADGNDQNATGSITFDVSEGTDFYVVASMRAIAKNGFVDASNTFTMTFSDNTGLKAASVSAVPVPAAAWLFGTGLLGFVGARKRKSV